MMGNKATGGPFAPLVVVVRNVVGEKDFNKLRGKAISLHSQGALLVCMIGPMHCEGMQLSVHRHFGVLGLAHCCHLAIAACDAHPFLTLLRTSSH